MKRIPRFKLTPEPLDDEARTFDGFAWAPDEVGTRHRLGGDPDFLEAEDWPRCPECSERMTFYAQLDSISDTFCIADCGLVYVFICFDDFTTRAIIHSS